MKPDVKIKIVLIEAGKCIQCYAVFVKDLKIGYATVYPVITKQLCHFSGNLWPSHWLSRRSDKLALA